MQLETLGWLSRPGNRNACSPCGHWPGPEWNLSLTLVVPHVSCLMVAPDLNLLRPVPCLLLCLAHRVLSQALSRLSVAVFPSFGSGLP